MFGFLFKNDRITVKLFVQLGFKYKNSIVITHNVVLSLQELVTTLVTSDEDSAGWI